MGIRQQLSQAATSEPFDLEQAISSLSIRSVVVATIALVVLIGFGALVRNRIPKLKLPIYLLILTTVLTTTLILAGSTVYLNVKSSSGGPVHWHADFEIWACGQPIAAVDGRKDEFDKLKDPNGFLSNKIGTTSLHEHDDLRIHLEGVVVEKKDASLGKFFRVIDGLISDDTLVVPLNDGSAGRYIDGQTCPDGSVGDVQVFVYSTNPGTNQYSQRKLSNPEDYIISPYSQVPPGDCVIVEFGPTHDRTDRKCLQYQVQDEKLGKYEERL